MQDACLLTIYFHKLLSGLTILLDRLVIVDVVAGAGAMLRFVL